MKKSELREIIREEIKNIQKEYSSGDIDYKKKLKNYFEKTNNTKRLEELENLPEVEVIKWYNYFKPFIEKSQLNESLAYICGTCGERAEHEEIEDNPNMRCSNCGNVNWE